MAGLRREGRCAIDHEPFRAEAEEVYLDSRLLILPHPLFQGDANHRGSKNTLSRHVLFCGSRIFDDPFSGFETAGRHSHKCPISMAVANISHADLQSELGDVNIAAV